MTSSIVRVPLIVTNSLILIITCSGGLAWSLTGGSRCPGDGKLDAVLDDGGDFISLSDVNGRHRDAIDL